MKALGWFKSLALVLVLMSATTMAADRGQVSLATTFSDSIRTNNTSNRYTVVLAQAGRLSVHLTTPVGTTGLPNGSADVRWLNGTTEVRRTNGFSFPHNDTMTVSAGTYHIEVIQRTVTGNYSIRINCSVNSVGTNNTRTTAQLLPAGYTVNGSITADNGIDIYRYNLTQPGRLTLNVTGGTLNSWVWIRWLNADSVVIRNDDRSLSSQYSQSVDLEIGTYYIAVARQSVNGTYSLTGSFVAAENNETAGRTRAAAQVLTSGQTVRGFLSHQDDIDIYRYNLTQPGRLTLNVTGGTLNSWVWIRWLNADSVVIRNDDRSLSSQYSQFVDLEIGTYYIAIVRQSGNTGTYTLTGTFTAANNNEVEPNNDRSTAQLLTSGQTVRGFLSHQDDIDMYRYELTQSGNLTVNITGGTLNSWVWIRWFDVNGTQIHNDDRTLSSSYSRTASLAAGTYYIAVVRQSGNTGTYNLTGTIVFPNAQPPNITTQPVGSRVALNGTRAISVTATSTDGGVLSYQWYRNTSASTTGATLISGATGSSYSVPTTTAGTTHYYVIVTNTRDNATGNRTATRTSDFAAVTVVGQPIISTQPTNQSIQFGNAPTAAFGIAVSANGATSLTYQWQISTNNGTTWSNVTDGSGGTTANYITPTLTTAMSGRQYRCIVTNDVNGQTISNSATLTVYSAPTITTQSQPRTVVVGNTALFNIAANVNGATSLTYQWQRSTNGTTWTSVTDGTGGTTVNYTTPATTTAMNGYVYRCVVRNNFNQETISNSAMLTVINPPTISVQPTSDTVTVSVGGTRTISVEATVPTGGAISYQWFSNTSANTTSGTAISGATSSSLSVPTSTVGVFHRYVVITNTQSSGTATVTSILSTTTVNPGAPVIMTQPTDRSVALGETCNISVTAQLPPTSGLLSYQWFRNTTASITGGTFVGTNSSSYSVPTSARGSYYFYVVITNTQNSRIATVTSNPITVTVNPTITAQPTDQIIELGQTAEFTVATELNGASSLIYQWQLNTNGTTWSNVADGAGGTSASYTTPTGTMAMNGHSYRCIVTNNFGGADTSAVVTLTVNSIPPTITVQPTNQTILYGETAEFTVEADLNGANSLSYQWQVSTDNGISFSDVLHGTTYTTPTAIIEMSGYFYRCIVTNDYGLSDTSDIATLTVNPAQPTITAQPSNQTIQYGETAEFTIATTLNGGTSLIYQWQVSTDDGVSFSDVSDGTGGDLATYTTPVATMAINSNRYRCIVTDDNDLSDTSNVATLTVNPAPPTINTHPSDQTIQFGQTADFTVEADLNGASSLTYQWQVRTNVTGSITVRDTIFRENFEGTNSFTIVNGSQTNQWHVGTTTRYSGTRSAYISNTNGSTNNYNINAASVVHMFRNVTFPTSTVPCTLSFWWKSNGENTTQDYDFLRVYLTETSVTPVAGTQLTSFNSTTLGTYKWNSNLWTQVRIVIPASNNGTTRRLVFSWVNDASVGTQPPVAVDEIMITRTTTQTVSTSFSDISDGTSAAFTTPTATMSMNGYSYRCIVTNDLGQSDTSNIATLTVNLAPPIITAHPSDTTLQVGQSARFTVAAELNGASSLTYQWQVSTNSGTSFDNVWNGSGSTTVTYTAPTATAAMNGYLYRCIVTNNFGLSDTTNSAALAVIYIVTYNINGGTGTIPAAQTVNAGNSVWLANGSEISRGNFTFDGWNIESDGTGTNRNAGTWFTPTGNITLYARWTPITYIITYNINGGTGITPTAQTVNAGNSVTLPSGSGFSRYQSTLGGWNTNSSGTGTNHNAGSSFTPTDNITLFAKWDVVISVLSPDRVIPQTRPDTNETVTSINQLTGEFTAGPNPVARSLKSVTFFRQGKRVQSATLTIFDASGNVINKIRITDNVINTQERREVGSWDLKDSKGRSVTEGTYLVRGVVITSDGKRERISLLVGVR